MNINKIKFILSEIKKGRMMYLLFSILSYPISKTKLKNWRLKIKDEILIKSLTKRIKKEHGLNFLNVYTKFYCEALREIYENKIYDFFKIKEGDIIYDVGAGGGEYSILCANKGAEALAFELRKDAYNLMNKNIKLNNLQNKIKTYLGRVNSKNGLDFYLEITKKKPSILKIDVEGDEMEVLIGSMKIIQKHHPKIIIETHSPELEKECLNFLIKLGYNVKHKIILNKNTALLFLE